MHLTPYTLTLCTLHTLNLTLYNSILQTATFRTRPTHGGVDVVDIVRLINIVLGQPASSIELYLADLNSDTILNIQDIVLLVNQILSN